MRGRILITGGSGFIGRGIMRAAKRDKWQCEFTVYSRDEYRQHMCREMYPDAGYFLGDVRDTERLALVARAHDVIIHAAAIKYIPEAERNVDEAIGINIYGSQSVVKAAQQAGVKSVVAISTDKAVECANTYGLTKAIGERIFTEAAWMIPSVKFTMVRYGNIIGSTGSVLPVFRQQYETFGAINVTDPSMTRFWLTADDAVELIQIAAEQKSGTILIPTDLKATRIGDIAKAIANNNINIVGIRPGEKLHEKLLTTREASTSIPDNLYNRNYVVYYPHGNASNYVVLSEIVSNEAETMDIETFMAAAADAELV